MQSWECKSYVGGISRLEKLAGPQRAKGCALYHRPIVSACKSLNDVGALKEYKGVKSANPRKF